MGILPTGAKKRALQFIMAFVALLGLIYFTNK